MKKILSALSGVGKWPARFIERLVPPEAPRGKTEPTSVWYKFPIY